VTRSVQSIEAFRGASRTVDENYYGFGRGAKRATKGAARREFVVKLRGGGKGELTSFSEVPLDVEQACGTRGRVPVKVTVNGVTYRSSMSPLGGGRHVIPVRSDRAEKAGVQAGDRVRVALERDTGARVVKPPPELARALSKNRAAKAGWDRCSYTQKKEHAESIREAKRAETRVRRVARAIQALARAKPAKR
jgi:hypothetical protein